MFAGFSGTLKGSETRKVIFPLPRTSRRRVTERMETGRVAKREGTERGVRPRNAPEAKPHVILRQMKPRTKLESRSIFGS